MKIYSIHYNKPEYIEIQLNTIKKFVNFPYEFIIVDNSINFDIKNQIREITNQLNLKYIDCNNSISGMSSISHQNSFNYLLNDVKEGDTIMIIDHDLFLYNYLTVNYYNEYDMVILPQVRGNITYPWPGMIIFNNIKNKSQISFTSGMIEEEPCDTGANLYYYIKNNNLKIKNVNESYFNNGEFLSSNLDDIFIHLISGSNWNTNYNLQEKINFLLKKIY